MLKSKGFKWKQVTNDVQTGHRIEIMECLNIHHKAQIDPEHCVIYREGMKREDIHKETFAFKISTLTVIGD